jgi:hypothetical protein
MPKIRRLNSIPKRRESSARDEPGWALDQRLLHEEIAVMNKVYRVRPNMTLQIAT